MKSLISVKVTAFNNEIIIRNKPKYIPEKTIRTTILYKLNCINLLTTNINIIIEKAETIYLDIVENILVLNSILFLFFLLILLYISCILNVES